MANERDAKKRFSLFHRREPKGISRADVIREPNLKKFFIIYGENFFGRLLSVNLLLILGNFPLLFLLMALFGVGQVSYSAPSGDLLSLLTGLTASGGQTPASLSLLGVVGVQTVHYANTGWTYALYALSALTLLTWGPVHSGVYYILRNLATGRPIFLMSDFFDTIKKNLRQSLPFGILDLAVIGLCIFNMAQMLANTAWNLGSFFFWVNVLIFILFFIMRWYVYLQMVSFRMKLGKMIQNALYFVLLGIKRNLLALLGIAVLSSVSLLFLLAFGGRLVVVAIALPALTLFSSGAFMGTYAAWYRIDDIMVIHADPEPGDAGSETGAHPGDDGGATPPETDCEPS